MRRRLPSPALVLASIALFVALAGAGVAAGLAIVRSPQPTMLVSGAMPASGKLQGGLAHGTERSTGVYTLTIRGDTFSAPNRYFPQVNAMISPTITIAGKGVTTIPPECSVAQEDLASNGSATVEVDCFTYDPAAGWVPAETGFDFQVVGPSR